NIEDKSAKYLSLLSIVITVFTLLLRFLSSKFFPPKSVFEWASCVAVFLAYAAMISSWSLLFRSLRPVQMPRLPISDAFFSQYDSQTLVTNHFELSKVCLM